jgi:hypothetical protein
MDPDHPKPGDLFNCFRDCDPLTEWCVPSNSSSTNWACDKKHKRGEASIGQKCVAGGGTVFCSNCDNGYFCQNDGSEGWECDPLSKQTAAEAVGKAHIHSPRMPVGSENALCSPCVQLGGQSLNALLNYILNAGVVEGCGKLCSHLKSKGAQTACDLVCGAVGIKAFIKALNKTDLDPIYFCEILHACPAGPDDAAVDLVGVTAQPSSISKGDTIELSLQLNVMNATGVGQFGISVDGPVTTPVSQRFLLDKGVSVGQQNLGVKLTVKDDDSGDFPVVWSPGTYKVTFEMCQGECRSKHPHSKFFGTKSSNFTLADGGSISV